MVLTFPSLKLLACMTSSMRNFLAIAFCVLAAAGCGRFDTLAQFPQTVLLGRVLGNDGTPQPNVDVYLVPQSAAEWQAKSDADGRFRVEVSAGTFRLALHDQLGNGLVQPVTLYPAGENDVGDLRIDSLQRSPAVVDITGIGYEERVTRSSNRYLSPVLAKSGEFFVAIEELSEGSDSQGPRIVRVDTASGAQTLVATKVDIQKPFELRLIDDRVISYTTGSQSQKMTLFLDIKDGRTINALVDLSWDFCLGQWNTCFINPFVEGDTLYLLARHLLKADSGGKSLTELHLVAVDLTTKTARISPVLTNQQIRTPTNQFSSEYIFPFFRHAGRKLIYHYYGLGSTTTKGRPLFAMDLSTLQEQQLANVVAELALGKTPDTLYLGRSEIDGGEYPNWQYITSLESIDVASGARHTLWKQHLGAEFRRWIADGENVLVGGISIDSPADPLFRISLPDGALTRFQGSYDAGEFGSGSICQYLHGHCKSLIRPDGTVRILDLLLGSNGLELYGRGLVAIDFDQAGQKIRTRIQTFTRDSRRLSDGLLFILQNDSQTVVSGAARGGFMQFFAAGQQDEFRQVSFLSADHPEATLSPDGKSLLYFVRDPLSGLTQLFRIRLR